jgi:hypothetical protein
MNINFQKMTLNYEELRMLPSSGIQRRVVRTRMDVSEKYIISVFKVENQSSEEPARSM